jgi:hypothetical protein
MKLPILHSIIKAGINRNQSIYTGIFCKTIWLQWSGQKFIIKSVEDRVVAYSNIDS